MAPQADERSMRITENCSTCGESTPHLVSLAFVKESERRPGISKKPVRTTECTVCGRTERDFQTRSGSTETIDDGRRVTE